jgi:ribosomal silencing factor RsfS
MTKNTPNADEIITFTINGIEDVKGQNITILDLRAIENTVCDYFIICCSCISKTYSRVLRYRKPLGRC